MSDCDLKRVLSIPVGDLPISWKAKAVLLESNIHFTSQLARETEATLLSRPRLGRQSLLEVKKALADLGMCLGLFNHEVGQASLDRLERRVDRLERAHGVD